MQAWLIRQNTYKWLSHDIMNEILGMALQAVFRDLVKEVQAAKYFCIICDMCFRNVDNIVKSHLLSLNIPLSNCHGQAYVGASNKRGNISDVQARIKESNKTAVYVYCMGHQLNLVV